MKNQLTILEDLKAIKGLLLRTAPVPVGQPQQITINWPLKAIDEFGRCEEQLRDKETFAKEVCTDFQ